MRIISAQEVLAELEAGRLEKTYISHDGARHADDTLALSRVVSKEPAARVCFTRNAKVLGLRNAPSLVFVDVGGVYAPGEGRFDHHFKDAPARPWGMPFSAFGLMSPDDEKEHPLVVHVDALDNGKVAQAPTWWPPMGDTSQRGDSIAWAVHKANPAHVDGSAVTDAEFEMRSLELIELFSVLFDDGVIVDDETAARRVAAIQRILAPWHRDSDEAAAASRVRVEAAVQACAGRVLVLSQYEAAALDVLAEQPAEGPLYLVFPGPGGRQWMVQQVAERPGSFKGRRPLPEHWAGKRDADFAACTGVADGVFCHPGRFIAGAKSRDGAIELAKLALA